MSSASSAATARIRPQADEYAPYYGKYIDLVPEEDILDLLERQLHETMALFWSIPEAKASSRYAPGKWSIKEVCGHIIDTERIFAYRALRIGRGDATPLPGFEQDGYVESSGSDQREWRDLIAEFEDVRRATLSLLRSLDDEAWKRRGTASQNTVSVRALAYMIAGHELHHREIVRSRYLGGEQE